MQTSALPLGYAAILISLIPQYNFIYWMTASPSPTLIKALL
ncbi:MAG: hypothetical protein ACYCTB_07770 [bacterium]